MTKKGASTTISRQVPRLDMSQWDIDTEEYPNPGAFESEAAYFSTAVHEAGHAVAWYGLGVGIREIRIEEDVDGAGRLGYVTVDDSADSVFVKEIPAVRIIALMAGGVAARKVPRDTLNEDGDERDFEQALVEAGRFLHYDRAQRQSLAKSAGMTLEEAFGPVVVSRERAEEYVRKLERVVSRVFQRRSMAWRALKAVVKELLKRPVIRGKHFEKVIAQTGFKRGSLRNLINDPRTQVDVPDPHGLRAKYLEDWMLPANPDAPCPPRPASR